MDPSTMAATAREASTAGSSSPRTSFVADSLILPTRNGRLFASAFALVYVHTFVSLSVTVLYAHPLATAVLLRVYSLVRDNDGGPGRRQHVVYASESDDEIRGHAKKLLPLYLAYLASQLATRAAVALAASATCRGDRRPRSLAELVRGKAAAGRVRGTLATAALVTVLEHASFAALLAACLALASWRWWTSGAAARSDAAASFVTGYVLFLLLLLLLSHLFLAAVFQVAIAASAADEGYGEGGTRAALRRAWRLMAERARRKEAAVMVLVASLLPVAISPVYAFAMYCSLRAPDAGIVAVLHGYLLPSVGVQLLSTVAAAVFYHRCMEHHHDPAVLQPTTKLAIAKFLRD
ncbi:hypothetical protein CFC21_049585 [Triticum aestivum]|uniref:Uncharacterized protein n=2 Tax=Triticum aestivum TaxID=4565 RepID=A0A3B6H116_WHEAT|nr:hypothetical protein CFC21_049585 [Triticum aestivum]